MGIFDFFRIVYDEVFVMQLLTVSFSLVWIFYPWAKQKKNILIGILHIVCVFAFGTLLNWLLFILSSYWSAIGGIHFQIALLLTISLYLGFFDHTYITSRFIMGATLFIMVITIESFGRQAMFLLADYFNSSTDHFKYTCYIAYITMIAFSFIIRRYTLKYYGDLPLISVVLLMINTIANTFLIVFKTIIMVKNHVLSEFFYFCVLVVIYIVSFTGYMMIYFHCKVRKEKTALEVQNKLLESDKQMLVVSGQAIEEMRALRHDMKNQYKVMELMLKEDRYEELKNYFRSVAPTFNQKCLSEFIDCGNNLVNSIINMEILKATSYGLKISTKINVPSQLPFESSDLCRIMVNLIDNAIEAVLRKDSRDYLIDVKIGKKSDYLYICVQNSVCEDYDRKELLAMNTVKDDAANHGYGHKIVKRIVEKYNGCVNYTVVENEFIAEVLLDLMVAENKESFI